MKKRVHCLTNALVFSMINIELIETLKAIEMRTPIRVI